MVSSAAGKDRALPMAKKTRMAALVPEIAAPRMELMTAIRTNIQAAPQSRLASRMTGFSVEWAKESMWLFPQPVMMATLVNTKKAPMMVMERRMARGMVRRGLVVSSASGAMASKPVKVKMEKTIAR